MKNWWDNFEDATPPSQGGIVTKPADPARALEVPIAEQRLRIGEQSLTNAELQEEQLRNPRPNLPPGYRLRPDGSAERVPGLPADQATEDGVKIQQKRASLDSLATQINRVQDLYGKNIAGQPLERGFGLTEMLPTPTNRQFDAASAGLAEQGLSAFRVPGVGAQSDTELRQFVQANRPNASDYDTTIEEKLRQLRTRVDATRKEMGLPPAKWTFEEQLDAALTDQSSSPQDRLAAANAIAGHAGRKINQDDAAAAAKAGRVGGFPVDPNLTPKPDVGNPVGAAMIGAADIGSMGLADEAGAALGALLPNAMKFQSGGSVWDGQSFGDAYNQNVQGTEGYRKAIQEEHPLAYGAGQVAGLLAGGAAAGRAVALKAPQLANWMANGGRVAKAAKAAGAEAVYGGGYGAGSDNENRGRGAAYGAIAAPIGSAAGRIVANVASRVISPIVQSTVRTLSKHGITMTPGQIGGAGGFVGRVIKGFEDRMAGFPIVGELVNSGRRESIEQLNRVGIDEALAPIGVKLPADVKTGHDAVAWAQRQAGEAYDAALEPIRAQIDAPLGEAMSAINARAAKLPKAQREAFKVIAEQAVNPFIPDDGIMDGRSIQAVKRGLDAQIAAHRASTPADNLLADVLDDTRSEIMEFAARSAPEEAEAFTRANDAYANLTIIERAAAKAKGGVFSPENLVVAVRQSDKSVRKRSTAAGGARMQGLSDAASQVLPSSVPDSGTAGRLVLPMLAAGGAGGGYATDGTQGAMVGASLALPYTSVGRKAIQAALIKRPEWGIRLGEGMRRNARVGGAAGTAGLLGYDKGK